MEAAQPSRTALRVALRRAAHQVYDSAPLVFEDPLAVQLLGDEFRAELARTEHKLHKPFSVAMRAFLVARSRFAEDRLLQAYAAGVRQYCLLGAGLDTFGLRNGLEGLEVFEIDHPATQAWKRELMSRAGLAAAQRLHFVAVDFESELLEEQLARAGFVKTEPAFFSWLGVVPYLTIEAFRSTLGFVRKRAAGSGVVMDYGQPRSVLPHLEQLAHDSLAERVVLAGEPFQNFFTPEEMRAEMAEMHGIEDLGREEINARYFAGRADGLAIRGAAGRVVCGWV